MFYRTLLINLITLYFLKPIIFPKTNIEMCIFILLMLLTLLVIYKCNADTLCRSTCVYTKKLLLPFLIKEKIVRVQPKTYYDEPIIYRSS